MYFDGSDVSLSDVNEDVWGVSADSSGLLYMTTRSTFDVTGLTGEGADVITCGNASLGNATIHDDRIADYGIGSSDCPSRRRIEWDVGR